MALLKGMQPLFDYFKTKNMGEEVTTDDLLAATGWKPVTLRTYINKHKLSRFMTKIGEGRYRVLRNGNTLKEDDIAGALTQVTPEHITLTRTQALTGKRSTYTLLRERGRGATAHVWEATALDGRRLAVKVINPRPDLLQPTVFSNVCDRFRRECKNGLKLVHPALVKYEDIGEHEGNPFLVMELAERSIGDVLRAQGQLSAPEAAIIVKRCAEALAYLHAQNCVHRDVKPDNLLQADRGVVLADLGIVRWSDLNPAFTSAGTLTRNSVQLGSWHYMAPEQHRAPHEAIPASDVYALGVTWYELVTGDRRTRDEFIAKAIPAAPVSANVNAMILRMTSFRAEERPGLDEVLAAL